jgi:6-phospho-3-hexuloisomerase
MEILKDAMQSITKHVEGVIHSLDEGQVNAMIDSILEAKKVFVFGAGRSGLVAKAFATRLMHLGVNVFVIGEILNPAIGEEDLLITISGSGETLSVVNAAKTAKTVKTKVAAITSYPNSSLARLADHVVTVKGRTKLRGEKDFLVRQIRGEHYSLAPLGTLFEVSVLIFLDGLIVELMTRLGITEEDMRVRHAVIE